MKIGSRSTAARTTKPSSGDLYRAAFLDWLGCATAGVEEEGSVAAGRLGRNLTDRMVFAGVAGHILDFDDTYTPGLVHISAPVAPVALLLGSAEGVTRDDMIAAFARGFEAMAAVAEASHPRLYERGWHSTAVCGVVGAATTAAFLLDLDSRKTATAVNISLLSASGLRGAFGSHGKSLQVGMAAASGFRAAVLAREGIRVPHDLPTGAAGFAEVYGASWAEPLPSPAIFDNWIKAYPCCLMTHSVIEAAAEAKEQGLDASRGCVIVVHPTALMAAPYADPRDGLEAKFSIPYMAAYAYLHGKPSIHDFEFVDPEARELSSRMVVRGDPALQETGAVLEVAGERLQVDAALGSPQNPMDARRLRDKLRELGAGNLPSLMESGSAPAADLIEASGLNH